MNGVEQELHRDDRVLDEGVGEVDDDFVHEFSFVWGSITTPVQGAKKGKYVFGVRSSRGLTCWSGCST